jgi:hypothetical protein
MLVGVLCFLVGSYRNKFRKSYVASCSCSSIVWFWFVPIAAMVGFVVNEGGVIHFFMAFLNFYWARSAQ